MGLYFRRGEQVIVTGDYDGITFFNHLGRIILEPTTGRRSVCVEFEQHVGGHNGGGRGRSGHCWWVPEGMCFPAKPTRAPKRTRCPRLK